MRMVVNIQRLVRGHLGRLYAVEHRKRLAQRRLEIAAAEIQRVYRGSRARAATKDLFDKLEAKRRFEATFPIQRHLLYILKVEKPI